MGLCFRPNTSMSDVIDSKELPNASSKAEIDWVRCIPFYLLHVSAISVFFVEFSWMAVIITLLLYFPRMFGLTNSIIIFCTSSFQNFTVVSVRRCGFRWSCDSARRLLGIYHRDHHRHSDTEKDIHSPKQTGFFYSHMGWFMTTLVLRRTELRISRSIWISVH